jgi:hypothetical protein
MKLSYNDLNRTKKTATEGNSFNPENAISYKNYISFYAVIRKSNYIHKSGQCLELAVNSKLIFRIQQENLVF